MNKIISGTNLVEIEKLCLSIFDINTEQKNRLLIDFDLRISPGMRIGITGPSGCGKTTLLRSIIDGCFPSATHFIKFAKAENLITSYVPQSQGLLPWYSLGRNISNFLKSDQPKDCPGTYSDQVIESLDLANCIDNFPDELSGGEKQRGLLACAIISKPSLFLADEPLTEIDLEKKLRMLRFWSQQIKQDTASLLLVSHDVDTLVYLCDTIIVLRGNPAATTHTFELSASHPRTWEKLFTGEPEQVRKQLHTLLISNSVH